MKKCTLVSSVFILSFILLGFNANTASATGPYNDPGYVSGCLAGDNFSRTTGQSCAPGEKNDCFPGDLFSSITGKSCPVASGGGSSGGGSGVSSQDDPSNDSSVAKFNTLFKSNFKIGARGDAVKGLQQFLKDEGYYFGKIDGKYGRITARAGKDFMEDNDITAAFTLTPPTIVPTPISTNPIISGVSGPQTLNVNQQ